MISPEDKIKYQTMEQVFLDSEFNKACALGDLEKVRYLLTSNELTKKANINSYQDFGLSQACQYGHLEIVRYLLASPELKIHSPIVSKDNSYSVLSTACRYGHLNIAHYLLTSPELKEHADIEFNRNEAFIWACQSGHVEIVKFLSTSSELKKLAKIYALQDKGFIDACENNHLEIVKFLFASPALKVHTNIRSVYEEGYIKACAKGHLDIIKYLSSSEDLKIHNNIPYDSLVNDGISLACVGGDLDILKYFMTSTELLSYVIKGDTLLNLFRKLCSTEHLECIQYLLETPVFKKYVDIQAFVEWGFIQACMHGQLQVVEFLDKFILKEGLNNKEYGFETKSQSGYLELVRYKLPDIDIDEHSHIYTKNQHGFLNACFSGNLNIIQYLVIEKNMLVSEQLKNKIKNTTHFNQVLSILEQHKLNQKLHSTLHIKDNNKIKRGKI